MSTVCECVELCMYLLIVHPLVSGDGVGHLSAGSSVLKQCKYM